MKYKEAKELLLKTEWKVKSCDQGCCIMIVPAKKIEYEYVDIDSRTIYTMTADVIIPSHSFISREMADHIVELHNKSLKE